MFFPLSVLLAGLNNPHVFEYDDKPVVSESDFDQTCYYERKVALSLLFSSWGKYE